MSHGPPEGPLAATRLGSHQAVEPSALQSWGQGQGQQQGLLGVALQAQPGLQGHAELVLLSQFQGHLEAARMSLHQH